MTENAYTFRRVSTGGIAVHNPEGVKVLFVPRYMARELAEFLAAEEADRTDGSE
ncbi:hypothetical protein [Microbacterium xylanilyticum]